MSREAAWRHAAIGAAIFVVLDQVTKQAVIASIRRGDSVNVFFGLNLTNTRNRGVAFGALAGRGWLVPALTLVALSLLIGYFIVRAERPWLWLPVGIIVGGALGNLADRARDGAVIDFIDPAFWPAFNLADTGIVLGILALLYVVEKK